MNSHARKPSAPTSIVRRARRMLALAFACACLTAILPASAHADLIVDIENFNSMPDHTGSFDVVLVNNDATSYNVSSDIVEVAILGTTGARFTDATTGTLLPYVYATSLPDFGTPILISLTNNDLTVFDTDLAPPLYYQVVGAGESYGLAHVSFLDDPFSPLSSGMISIVPGGTSISDDLGHVIYPLSAVPEPSSLVSATIGLIVGAGCLYGFRGRREGLLRDPD